MAPKLQGRHEVPEPHTNAQSKPCLVMWDGSAPKVASASAVSGKRSAEAADAMAARYRTRQYEPTPQLQLAHDCSRGMRHVFPRAERYALVAFPGDHLPASGELALRCWRHDGVGSKKVGVSQMRMLCSLSCLHG